MKRYYFQILLACCLTLFAGCSDSDSESGQNGIPKGSKAIDLQQDRSGLLRNPCMGWGLYDDAVGNVANAEEYWAAQDEAARNYASFFYIRWRWSEMEPEEGKYAWIYDENYKKLIQGALDRGLKLCFRIYDNGQDNIRQGTPNMSVPQVPKDMKSKDKITPNYGLLMPTTLSFSRNMKSLSQHSPKSMITRIS